MLQSECLRICCDYNLMHTGVIAKTKRVYADLVLFSLVHTVSAIYKLSLGANFTKSFCKHFCSSAGSVSFSVMVSLNYFNICIGEKCRCLFCKVHKHRNAKGKIGCEEYGNRLRSFCDQSLFFVGVSCGSNNNGESSCNCIGDYFISCAVVGKVDNNVSSGGRRLSGFSRLSEISSHTNFSLENFSSSSR